MARRSSYSVHQRLDQYSRRRRMMLNRESPALDTSQAEAVQNQSDEQPLRKLQYSAEYQSNRGEHAAQRRELTAHFMQGTAAERSTGPAILAEFPDVESEKLPVKNGHTTNLTGVDALLRGTLEGGFSGKPLTATQGMNQLRAWVHDSQPRVWMFVGDETTAWMRHHGKPGFAEMFRHRLRWELHRQTDLVVNAGSLGAGIVEIAQITRQGLEQCRADVVFMLPGGVDADQAVRHPHLYANQLTELAAQIREQGAEPVFQTPPVPFGAGSAKSPCPLAALADVVREVSVVHQIPLIDHAEFWLEHPTPAAWSKQNQGAISSTGHVLLALLMFSEFDIYDRRSSLCSRLQSAWEKAIPPAGTKFSGNAPAENKARSGS